MPDFLAGSGERRLSLDVGPGAGNRSIGLIGIAGLDGGASDDGPGDRLVEPGGAPDESLHHPCRRQLAEQDVAPGGEDGSVGLGEDGPGHPGHATPTRPR